MGEHTAVPADEASGEAVATIGLFLIVSAVIAAAVSLASWGLADGSLAIVAGTIALLGFAGSILCFRTQAGDREPQPLPVG